MCRVDRLRMFGRKWIKLMFLAGRHFWSFQLFFFLMLLTIFYLQTMTNDDSPSTSYANGPIYTNYLVMGESLTKIGGDTIVTERSFSASVKIVAKLANRNGNHLQYYPFHFPPSKYYTQSNLWAIKGSMNDSEYNKYFDYLKVTKGSCRKLVKLGGTPQCDGSGDERQMDGHKIICLDPEFQIPTKEITSCVAFSFGVSDDTTFDEDIRNANCQVYMYDVDNFRSEWMRNESHVHFFQIGLAAMRLKFIDPRTKAATDFTDFGAAVLRLGLQTRLVNVLKMDIEGSEWDIISNFTAQPYLDLIGQIAIEFHSVKLLHLKTEAERREKLLYWTKVIRELEERGFRRVVYWDNYQPRYRYKDVDGTQFETSGEMLLINYNWYNQTFRSIIRNRGYNFV